MSPSDSQPAPSVAPLFDHERLKVYRDAISFVAWVEDILEKAEGKAAAKDQLDRASTSTPLNIAEGNGKSSARDRIRYLESARGSAFECAACLDVLVAKRRLVPEDVLAGKKMLHEIVCMLTGLMARVADRIAEEVEPYGVEGEQGR